MVIRDRADIIRPASMKVHTDLQLETALIEYLEHQAERTGYPEDELAELAIGVLALVLHSIDQGRAVVMFPGPRPVVGRLGFYACELAAESDLVQATSDDGELLLVQPVTETVRAAAPPPFLRLIDSH